MVELKVGLEGESQVQQFLKGMKKILRSSSKFDSKYWVVKGLQGTNTVQKLLAEGKIEFRFLFLFSFLNT